MQVQKFFTQLHQPVIVMACRHPPVGILRESKAFRISDDPGIADPAGRQQRLDLPAHGSVWIAQSAHRISRDGFERFPILKYFCCNLRQGTPGNGGMRHRMAGDFMSPVKARDLLRMNPVFGQKHAAVQMKGSPDPIPVEYIHQPAVRNFAVVIAHGQRFVFPARKAAINLIHLFSFQNRTFLHRPDSSASYHIHGGNANPGERSSSESRSFHCFSAQILLYFC